MKNLYTALYNAFTYFNHTLFQDQLPDVTITLDSHNAKSNGWFAPARWDQRRAKAKPTHEINMNAANFRGRSDKEILSTLVHEMCHLQQQTQGKPSRNGYHNAEWGAMMEAIGLTPSDTGAPGGKKTGQHMTHYITKDGKFSVAYDTIQQQGYTLPMQREEEPTSKGKSKGKSKNKIAYVCPNCEIKVWGKPGLSISCNDCEQTLEEEA